MSIENTPVDDNVDLDAFSAELFGQSKAEPVEANPEEAEVETEEVDANEEDTRPEDDTLESEEDEAPVEKPKQSRAQKRIEELVAKNHETERRLEAALAKLEKSVKPEPEPVKTATDTTDEPQATDLNEDGTEKYPLGEFDPKFIRDLAKYAIKAERDAAAEAEAKTTQEKEAQAAEEALQASWSEKLGPAKERYPDFSEKGEELFDTFADLDPAYGQYLVATLMDMEFGPDVLYYLANNVDEANRIVKMGPNKAVIALGRLEARFDKVEEEPVRQKVTKAPPPPTSVNKGTTAAKSVVPDDTDDLEAFAAKLFPKRR